MKTYLHLNDGEALSGEAFGYSGESSGEVVFSTGMTGYPQSLTDPSFAGQILVFTYPLIGNYGVPKPVVMGEHLMRNLESERIWVRGVVVGEYCQTPSHYLSFQTFSDWLIVHKIPGIAGVDTRALTQKLREHGVMPGIITTEKKITIGKVEQGNWVKETSCADIINYKRVLPLGSPNATHKGTPAVGAPRLASPALLLKSKRIVLIDCGVKHGIIRALLKRGHEVIRIPWDADPLDLKNIDGVVCSNGPGDPQDCGHTIKNIRKVIAADIPFLGVCLGHQLLALAIGADTYKMKYGHRGLNQPCQDLSSGKAYVTSQNHGYAVKLKTIPKEYEPWFVNLNDHTNEGMRHKTKPIWSTQFHPEGNPGPFDTEWVFDIFTKSIK